MARCLVAATSLTFLAAVVAFIGCNNPSQRNSSFRPDFKGMPPDAGLGVGPDEVVSDRDVLATTHLAAGNLFEKQQQFEKAIWQYRLALQQAPDCTAAYNRLGICLNRMGQFQQAEQVFRQAVPLEPRSAYLKNNLAFNLMLQGRWIEAEQLLRSALELKPDYRRARINLGVTLGKQSRFDEAFRQFRPVLGDALAYYNMGMMYKAGKMYPQSAAAFNKALEIEPRLDRAHENLAEVTDLLARLDVSGLKGSPIVRADMAVVEPSLDSAVIPGQIAELDPARGLETQVQEAPEPAQPSPVVELVAESPEGRFDSLRTDAEPNTLVESSPALYVPDSSYHADPAPSDLEAPETIAAIESGYEDPFSLDEGNTAVAIAPPSGYVLLDNEPCEARAVSDLLDLFVEEMQPCREQDWVDQFAFRLSHTDKPASQVIAQGSETPADSAATNLIAPARTSIKDSLQHLDLRQPWNPGEIDLSDVQGFRLPDLPRRGNSAP